VRSRAGSWPGVDRGLGIRVVGAMRPPVSSSASDGLHRIQVVRPQGRPPGIATAERYRVARCLTDDGK